MALCTRGADGGGGGACPHGRIVGKKVPLKRRYARGRPHAKGEGIYPPMRGSAVNSDTSEKTEDHLPNMRGGARTDLMQTFAEGSSGTARDKARQAQRSNFSEYAHQSASSPTGEEAPTQPHHPLVTKSRSQTHSKIAGFTPKNRELV